MMRFGLVLVGAIAVLAACGGPVDERARVAGVLQDDRDAAPRTAPSGAPSAVLQGEARADAQRRQTVVLTPAAPRPDEPTPPRRTAPVSRPLAGAPPAKPAPPPEAAPAEPVIAGVEPARLMGLGRSELANLMGTPSILRTEPPGELWLYKNEACVAHVYLYENGGPDDYRVRYVETRGADAAVSTSKCLAAFANAVASTVSLDDAKPKD